MKKERRKHKRVQAPTVSIAAIAGDELSAIVGSEVMFGKVHDINPDAVCATMDQSIPEGNTIEFILRMFRMDLKFIGNVIRSHKDKETTYVAFLFDWDKTPNENKVFLRKYLENASALPTVV